MPTASRAPVGTFWPCVPGDRINSRVIDSTGMANRRWTVKVVEVS